MKKDNTTTNYKMTGRTNPGVTYVRPTLKLSRNDLCYCGSGLKYKKCHLPAQVIVKTEDLC